MESYRDDVESRRMNCVRIATFLTLALTFLIQSAYAQTQAADVKAAEPLSSEQAYQTFYLASLTRSQDAMDLVTDLRNMLPGAKLFYVSSENAISMRGTSDDIKLAQKILADIDRVRTAYRITYAITDIDNGKRLGTQRFALVVVSGGTTNLKQGSKVPIVTGTIKEGTPTADTQVQYLDVGLNIQVSLDGSSSGLRLRTKVEQSSVADEKSGIGAQDPVIRQTALEATSTLVQGKPVVLGSIDIPGTTRRQEIEVVSEPVG